MLVPEAEVQFQQLTQEEAMNSKQGLESQIICSHCSVATGSLDAHVSTTKTSIAVALFLFESVGMLQRQMLSVA